MIFILTGDLLRGHTDAIILSLLKNKDSYGYEINNHITTISNNNFSLTEATMYTTLKRLEKNNYITSYWKDGINTKRKYYKITKEGINYLLDHLKSWHDAKKILNKFLEE
ncbi:MAG TPA: PadR family transcriptional regulator [Acholeplasma sp.]|nr:PadR family transcriptional regulator [Acholeplasma sp.]